MDRGIHVHARKEMGEDKEIDRTARAVQIFGECLPQEGLLLCELDAICYMVTSVFGHQMKFVTCGHCGYPHLDKDWFSIHPHRRHLCAGCGRHFRDSDTAIGNPICGVREALGVKTHRPQPSIERLHIKQADYPGGLQVWGSNPAFLWTSRIPEREGIHVHAFNVNSMTPVIDETFGEVSLDGVVLSPKMVRILMAQMTLPSLTDRVVSIKCSACGTPHYSIERLAYTPITSHECRGCGSQARPPGRLRKTVVNPLVGILKRLAETAPRQPQRHNLGLIPETL